MRRRGRQYSDIRVQWSVGAGGAILILDTPTALNSRAQRRATHAGVPITQSSNPNGVPHSEFLISHWRQRRLLAISACSARVISSQHLRNSASFSVLGTRFSVLVSSFWYPPSSAQNPAPRIKGGLIGLGGERQPIYISSQLNTELWPLATSH